MEYIELVEGEINGKFIFIMKLLCKQVQNHPGRGRSRGHKRSGCDLISQSEDRTSSLDQSEASRSPGDDL